MYSKQSKTEQEEWLLLKGLRQHQREHSTATDLCTAPRLLFTVEYDASHSITYSVAMNLHKLQETEEGSHSPWDHQDSDTPQRLNNNKKPLESSDLNSLICYMRSRHFHCSCSRISYAYFRSEVLISNFGFLFLSFRILFTIIKN